jgi:hypothetical protein
MRRNNRSAGSSRVLVRRSDKRGKRRLYFLCICDILQNPQSRLERMADVNMLKAKLVKLHILKMKVAKFDLDGQARGRPFTLFININTGSCGLIRRFWTRQTERRRGKRG